MIKYLNCSCINSKCSTLVNQINVSGNMDFNNGLEFSIRFPSMYNDYLKKYKDIYLKLSQSYLFDENGFKIINMACYESYLFPTTLEIIEDCLKNFVKNYQEYNIQEVAFPLLGCDDEGLRMVNVLPIMEKYLKPLPIDCYICFDIDGLSNIELQMIEALKTIDLSDLKKYANLSEIEVAVLINKRNSIIRFEDIYRIQEIDSSKYRLIYDYFYNSIYKRTNPFHQQTLF